MTDPLVLKLGGELLESLADRQRIAVLAASVAATRPLIIVHGNALRHVTDAYRRYLEHFFAEAFQLRGTPLRIQFKAGANPYAESPGRRR